MNIQKPMREPVVWMNVTTSANWNRPPVGIVRVEEALYSELAKLLGPTKFKSCVWMDGEFVEWVPKTKHVDQDIQDAVDVILPRTPSFDMSRQFLTRALRAFKQNGNGKNSLFESTSLNIDIPLREDHRMRPSAGDILISVGLDWDQPYTAEFFHLTKKRGIKIVTCCYDLIPVLFPQYCVGDVATRFKEYFNLLTWGSAAVLCISEQTKRDYIALCEQIGAPERPTKVIPLGDNVPANVGTVSDQVKSLLSEPFILFVSTIERRKNHEVLYRAYHLLCRSGKSDQLPKLVFVGMPGWGVGDLLKDIELDPLTEGLVVQLNHVNDAELNNLYRSALFCVYPSLYEGWGLPVGEALSLGKAVLASDQGSLPEVGGDLVRYMPAWNPNAWADAIWDLVSSPETVERMEERVRTSYSTRTWAGTAKSVLSLINDLLVESGPEKTVLYPGYDFSTQVGIHVGHSIQSTGKSGYLMFGPFRSLRPGNYTIEIFGSSRHRSPSTLSFDCVTNGGARCFWQGAVTVDSAKGDGSSPVLSFSFSVDEEVDDFEIRCIVDASMVTISKVVITRDCVAPFGSSNPSEHVEKSSAIVDVF